MSSTEFLARRLTVALARYVGCSRLMALETSEISTILELRTVRELSAYLDGLPALKEAKRRCEAVADTGELLVPGDEYLLDAMVSRCDLIPETSMRSLTGASLVAAVIEQLPDCNLCKSDVARYDAQIMPTGYWGYMCGSCYRKNSKGVLGAGVGQYLFTIDELCGSIRQVIDHIAEICWGD